MAESVADEETLEGDRIHPIYVETEYLGRYQSVNRVRDCQEFHIDEPKNLGGKNAGPTALEATLAALNSCTAMIMYILSREQSFDLKGIRFETEGWVDARRIEMKRSKLKYSEVEPIAEHYQKVGQKVIIQTSESEERIKNLQSETHRLCPVFTLLSDAGVPIESEWVAEQP